MKTQGSTVHEDWLEARRSGVGGSDIAAILGHDPYGRTALDVWNEKMGIAPPQDDSVAMRRGRVYEDMAAARFAEKTGYKVRRQQLRRHKEHPFLLANVDRMILSKNGRGPGVLEVKSPGFMMAKRMREEGLRLGYVLQLQHYMEVLDLDWGAFSLWDAESADEFHFEMERDRSIGQQIIEKASEFWRCVEAGAPPEVSVAEVPDPPEIPGDLDLVYRTDAEWSGGIARLADAEELRNSSQDLWQEAREHLKELAGGYGVYQGAGRRVYYRQVAGSKTLDKAKLQKYPLVDGVELVRILTADDGEDTTFRFTHDEARQIVESARLNLDDFYKQGKPREDFRSYPVREEGHSGNQDQE